MRRQRLAHPLFCSPQIFLHCFPSHFSNAMKRPLFLALMLLVVLGAASTTFAQKKLPKPNWKGFDEFVEAQLKEWDAPGCAVAVVKDGEIILAKGYGLRDVKNKKPMKASWESATSVIAKIHALY